MATQPSWQESSRRSNRSPENNRRSERIRVNAFHFVPGSASVSMFVPDSVSFPDPAFVSVLYSDPISVPASDSVPESVSAPWVPHTSVLRVGLLTFPSVIPTEAAFWFTLSFEVPTRDLLFRPPPKQPSRNASVGAGLRPARAASANNCVRNPRRAQSNRLDIVVSAARAPPRRPRPINRSSSPHSSAASTSSPSPATSREHSYSRSIASHPPASASATTAAKYPTASSD